MDLLLKNDDLSKDGLLAFCPKRIRVRFREHGQTMRHLYLAITQSTKIADTLLLPEKKISVLNSIYFPADRYNILLYYYIINTRLSL